MSQQESPDINALDQTPSSIVAAAHAYQAAMEPTFSSENTPLTQAAFNTKDVAMADGIPDRAEVHWTLLFRGSC